MVLQNNNKKTISRKINAVKSENDLIKYQVKKNKQN